ncbi:MAG: hypothetical protein ACI9WU_001002, partial [Myxococcota bacterium]
FSVDVWTIACDDRTTTLSEVSGDKRRLLLGTARFMDRKWQRRSYALARDDFGTYFFVDRGREPDSRDFRIFVGPRGAVKLQKMKNIVYDSAGAIFTTSQGQLRLVLNDKDARWIKKGKTVGLTYLPLSKNRYLIHAELGMYTEERLGTPCDDL